MTRALAREVSSDCRWPSAAEAVVRRDVYGTSGTRALPVTSGGKTVSADDVIVMPALRQDRAKGSGGLRKGFSSKRN